MVNIVIINKSGDCKTLNVKNFVKDDLYKKCGFKSSNNFENRHSWSVKLKQNNINIEIYAKDNGRANTENKFDFPPPIDNELYFGNIAIVAYKNKEVVDIDVDDWCKVYEKLMGGFENLGDKDTSDDDEEDDIPPEQLTKEGYMKDDFIVDSDDDDDNDVKPIKKNKKQKNDNTDDEDSMTEEETTDDEDESFEISNEDNEEDDDEEDDDDDESDVISELSEEEYINE